VDSESVKLNLLLREIQPLRSFDFFCKCEYLGSFSWRRRSF
jgi:hypothetical protein